MFKNSFYRLLFKLVPAFFNNRNIISLKNKKTLHINFLDDKYIYKNIDKGYELLYKEYNFGHEGYVLNSFNRNLIGLKLETLQEIHSFNWLQNLKIINNQNSYEQIFILVDTWINNIEDSTTEEAYNIEVLAARIFNWLTSKHITEVGDSRFKNKVLKSLSFQIRFFLKAYMITSNKDSLLLNKTLFSIGRSINSNKIINISLDNILLYLKNNILADGGILNASPSEILCSLENVLFVYKNLTKSEITYKNELCPVIDKMIIFIKSLRYKDGGLGVFNGGYEEESGKISFILSLGNINANPFKNLRYSGYYLNSAHKIDVTIKTNSILAEKLKNPKNSNSILSNEIVLNGVRVFVNNSISSSLPDTQNSRDSYSTMLFYDKHNKLIDMPPESGIQNCKHRADSDWDSISIAYKGLQSSYGIIWHKTLSLAKRNSCILGEELISVKNVSMSIERAVLKFILHPGIVVKRKDENKRYVYLEINDEVWVFRVNKDIIEVQELYKGIKDMMYNTTSLNIPMSMEDKALEWSLSPVALFNTQLKEKSTKI